MKLLEDSAAVEIAWGGILPIRWRSAILSTNKDYLGLLGK